MPTSNHEARLIRQRAWRKAKKLADPDLYRKTQAAYQVKYHAKHPKKKMEYALVWNQKTENRINRMLHGARFRAKKAGVPFNIGPEDIEIPERCPILDMPLVIYRPGRGVFGRDTASLDRVDPTKGYVKGNIEVISGQANVMKSDASPAELIQFAKVMLARYGEKS